MDRKRSDWTRESEDESVASQAFNDASDHEADTPAAAFRRSLDLSTLYSNIASAQGSVGDLSLKKRYLQKALGIVQRRFEAEGGSPDSTSDGRPGAPKPHPSLLSTHTTCLPVSLTPMQRQRR